MCNREQGCCLDAARRGCKMFTKTQYTDTLREAQRSEAHRSYYKVQNPTARGEFRRP